jgi:hypothetical protein
MPLLLRQRRCTLRSHALQSPACGRGRSFAALSRALSASAAARACVRKGGA